MQAAVQRGWTASGDRVPNNLPRPLTSFVGRGVDLSRLKSIVARSRMVTLTGPGGAGKSRLAAELGRKCLDRWPHAVCWVGLAPVANPGQVATAVLSALELPGQGAAQEVVIAWLANRRALLILDSCEHLLTACADFCQAALERCPELTILATSREALGVPGEAQWPVSSLRVSDALRLFEDRAILVRPDFKVAARNTDVVAEICERIDDLPLAIELAAARIGVMTEQDILDQLSDRFSLLASRNRAIPERQRTMSATIDWSYRLLTEGEALLFRRLSVFSGGFDLESMQAVCGEGLTGRALDLLAALVQKQMVVAERMEDGGMRYRLLESQLAYADDRLRAADESQSIRRRHYEYFFNELVARKRNPVLVLPPPGLADTRWIAREFANLRTAMDWARNSTPDLGLTFAAHLSFVPFGDVSQARSLLRDLLNRSPEKGVPRVYALRSAAALAIWQGDSNAAVSSAEEALHLARELGNLEVLAYALTVAAVAHEVHGEVDIAAAMYEEANTHLKGLGHRPLTNQIRTNVGWLGVVRRDYVAARDLLIEATQAARLEGDPLLHASGLYGLGWAYFGLHDYEQANDSFKQAIEISVGFRDYPELVSGLNGLICLAVAGGEDQRALRLAAGADRLSGEWSVRSEPWPRVQADESLRVSRSRLATRNSEAAWKEGLAMSWDQLVDYALTGTGSKTADNAGPLTRREREVAKLVAEGMTNRQIGERLFISWRTVEGHVDRIRNRLGARSRSEVAAWFVEQSLSSDKVAPEVGLVRKTRDPGAAASSD